jgi:hypothetical protein
MSESDEIVKLLHNLLDLALAAAKEQRWQDATRYLREAKDVAETLPRKQTP